MRDFAFCLPTDWCRCGWSTLLALLAVDINGYTVFLLNKYPPKAKTAHTTWKCEYCQGVFFFVCICEAVSTN